MLENLFAQTCKLTATNSISFPFLSVISAVNITLDGSTCPRWKIGHYYRVLAGVSSFALGPAAVHLGEVWLDVTWPAPSFSGVPFNFCFKKFSQKRTVWTLSKPRDTVFRGPWPQGWRYGVESLAVLSACGRVSLCQSLAWLGKW